MCYDMYLLTVTNHRSEEHTTAVVDCEWLRARQSALEERRPRREGQSELRK